jgi:hypothetical protein
MAEDAERYWLDFETATGERVVLRALGQWFRDGSGLGASAEGLWGLLILTDATFRFRYIPSDNWIKKMLGQRRTKTTENEAVEIVVPLENLRSLNRARRGFLDRLFGPPWPRFQLSWKLEGQEGERSEAFAVDNSRRILEAIEKALVG